MISRYTLNGKEFDVECEVFFEDVTRYMPRDGKHEWCFDGKPAFFTEGTTSEFSVFTIKGDLICRSINESLYDVDEYLMGKFFGIFKVGEIRKVNSDFSRRFTVRTKFEKILK